MTRGRASRLPLRVRLVAGFSAVMLVVLAAAGAFVYWRVQYALDHGLDADLALAARTITPLVAPDGVVADSTSADATGAGWQVLDAAGTVLSSGGPVGDRALVSADLLASVPASGETTRDVGTFLPAATSPYRVRLTAVGSAIGPTYLLVAVPRARRDEALRELLLQLGLAGLGALALTALVGERLAWFALLPVERFRRRAEEIARGAVGVRLDVPEERDDEVTRLGHTLNEMLAALEQSVERERRFVDEASHELRTPLTLLSSRVQLARRRRRTVAEHEVALDELDVDIARLARLADHLLALGTVEEAWSGTADTTTVVGRLAERLLLVSTGRAPDRPIEISLPQTPVAVALAPVALERVLTNVIDNALAYGAAPIELSVDLPDPAWARVVVSDGGPGMPPELLATATERFSRSVEARAEQPGAGLGLALVRAIVVAAGGEVRLCHDGHHESFGRAVVLACAHDARMTVTVVLPSSPA